MDNVYLPAFCNFVICIGIAFVSFCRLNSMHNKVRLRVQLEYVVYLAGALLSGFRPWWWDGLPHWPVLIMPAAMLIGLLCSSYAWDSGPPRVSKHDSEQ